MKVLYNIFIFLYSKVIRVASVFNPKARQWVDGRKDLFSQIKDEQTSGNQNIWVHCASLGEFEQGRPVIEMLRATYPDHRIVLTFFSPSGYEVRKNYEYADNVYYLPIDTIKNARQFVSYINPKLVIFVKYEFWFNYIDELYRQKIPLIFVSVIFRPSQHFFKPWGKWYVRQINKATHLFVQNEESIDLLDSIGIYHAKVSGDTRFDRVLQLPDQLVSYPVIEQFKGASSLLIAGSTWQPDEKIIHELILNSKIDFKLIIAPHLINKEHIDAILNRFENYNPVLYSNASTYNFEQRKVLIIDSIGMLSMLYRYADIAFIGGGFGVGIHNLLEATTYGVPVIFGPNYKRFHEAVELKENGGGFPINNSKECLAVFDKLMTNENAYKECASTAKRYVRENAGATQLIINKVKEYIIAG
ncbi:MAG: 3-deoxy-D-manno-octulosonic acid transferase [Bacteroidetes bacterium]|nr:3-deoxy-D-manno-octulosonic acid transferase [Bacteroidota bacterium]MBL6944729.1 3-deoxy-D-manno-octulosonic acid transferase [Bacteroidales bacterium]